MYKFERHITHAWVLPIVKYALDNNYISTRASLNLDDISVGNIVSSIMKNFYVKTLQEYGLPGKVIKEGKIYMYYPGSPQSHLWIVPATVDINDLPNYADFAPWRYFHQNIRRMDDAALNQKPNFVRELVASVRNLEVPCADLGIDTTAFLYKMPLNPKSYGYDNVIVRKMQHSRQWFATLKQILTTFQGA